MARRKSSTKKRTTRRRRMSGTGSANLMQPVLMIGGALLGKFLTNKFLATQTDTIKGAAQIGVGILAGKFVKNNYVQAMGSGMIVSGGITIGKSLNPALFGATDDVLVINGDISEINGIDQIGLQGDISEINGDISEINGDLDAVNGIDQIGGDFDF